MGSTICKVWLVILPFLFDWYFCFRDLSSRHDHQCLISKVTLSTCEGRDDDCTFFEQRCLICARTGVPTNVIGELPCRESRAYPKMLDCSKVGSDVVHRRHRRRPQHPPIVHRPRTLPSHTAQHSQQCRRRDEEAGASLCLRARRSQSTQGPKMRKGSLTRRRGW